MFQKQNKDATYPDVDSVLSVSAMYTQTKRNMLAKRCKLTKEFTTNTKILGLRQRGKLRAESNNKKASQATNTKFR